MTTVTDPDIIAQLNQMQESEKAPQAPTPSYGQDVTDPALIHKLEQRRADLNDDSWRAAFSDFTFNLQSLGYGVGDEIAFTAGGEEARDAYKAREELSRQRSPIGSLLGEIAAGIAVDAGAYAGVGALAGSVVPGAGNIAGGVAGGAVGLGKGIYRGYKAYDRLRDTNKATRLAGRAGQFAGIGGAHGYGYGFGSTDGTAAQRHQGGLQEAQIGALFGGAIPVVGAGLRGAGRLTTAGASQGARFAASNKLLQQGNANALTNAIAQRLPQVSPNTSKRSLSAAMSEATAEAHNGWDVVTKQHYKALDDAGIKVDLAPWKTEVDQLIRKYKDLPGGTKTVRILEDFKKGSNNVDLSDARFVRSELNKISTNLNHKDFDKLYKGITGSMRSGALKSGHGSLFDEADKFYREGLEEFKSSMMKQGLKDGGFAPSMIRQAVVGENNGKHLDAIRSHFNALDNRGVDTKPLREDFASLSVNELLKKDGSALRNIVDNSPDQGKQQLLTLTGDKELTNMLIELGKTPKGLHKESSDGLDKLLSNPLALVGVGGFVSPSAAVAQLGASIGMKQFSKLMATNPKAQRMVRSFIKWAEKGGRSEAEVATQMSYMKSELMAAAVVLGGATTGSYPDWVYGE